ncbi:beta strand repeat-containing protein [Rhizobium hainanense]|uniref:Ca2+-binding protein, RTX toxin-related n=1 Tax=Rhizobium hainanense TaxID=52131 RepID=A0A1C3WG15_9HYPH|nr:calcium-binding protein [Rhizobium hainanense]SCB38997.1 Ca2+-binding protein, RTX toxin-related [Rhizobium hainanense]
MADIKLPVNMIRKMWESFGDATEKLAPDEAERYHRQSLRDSEKSIIANGIVDELKKDFPDGSFNEGAVRSYINDQYDRAIKAQDVDHGATQNPDGSINNDGMPWRMRADSGFEERVYGELGDGIRSGEYPPPEPPTEAPTEPPTEAPTEPPTEPPTDEPSPWPPAPPAPPRDPLVLDLDGNGVELISLADSRAHFDYQRDGFAEKTGWLNSNDAFLVHDDNKNGVVDGISELFGSPEQDGFTALRAFDTNGDGKVDASDEGFANLKLWRDLNGNGVFDAGELFSLAEYNIASINVSATATNRITAGNHIAFEGSFTRTDGSIGKAEAVLFNTNPAISRWDMPDGFEVSAEAEILPNLKGYGLLPDLLYSMTLDDDLRQLVETFVIDIMTLPAEQIRPRFEALLFSWANVTDVPTDDRGGNIDGKIVAFLENYFGSELADGSNRIIGSRYADVIEASFDTVVDVLLTRFLSQSSMAALDLGVDIEIVYDNPFLFLTSLAYRAEGDQFLNSVENIASYVIAWAPSDDRAKFEYYAKAITGLQGLKYEYFANDNVAFKEYVLSKVTEAEPSNFGLLTFVGAYLDVGRLTGGNAGADSIVGTSGMDVMLAGLGDDVLNGGSGNDTYVYARGDGNDTIVEGNWSGTNDRLVFTDINSADVKLVRNGTDLKIVIAESAPGAGDAGSILIKDTLDDILERGIEKIVFADGTVWDRNYLRTTLLAQAATAGNDTINGFNVADTIAGGRGDDVLNGGIDNDTYVYARGDGNDTIDESSYNQGSADKLILANISPSDVTLVRNGYDVTLVIAESTAGAGDAGSVLLKSEFWNNGGNQGLEQITFADGTVWSQATLRNMILTQSSTAGNDTIVGFDYDDTITGGRGDDLLKGGAGNDTYYYARGDGNDTIDESSYNQGSADKLILANISPSDVTLVRNGYDVTLVIAESTAGAGDAGSVLLKSEFWNNGGNQGLEQITFADGTVWSQATLRNMILTQSSTAGNDTIVGFDYDDTITGGRGDDLLKGGAGNDTYYYARGDGNDTIDESSYNQGSADKLILANISPSDVTLVRNGYDVTLVIAESTAGDGGSILLKSEFWNNGGNQGVEQITFADGTVWSQATLRNMILAQSSTAGNDTIVGFDYDDTITGGRGDDLLKGGAGNDTYIYSRGDGNDTIDESIVNQGNADKLVLTNINPSDVTLVRNGNDVTLVIAESTAGAGDGGSILLKSELVTSNAVGVEQIVFADGTTWNRAAMNANVSYVGGTNGNDTIAGTSGNDLILTGLGSDTITGGGGNDVFVFKPDFGRDTITDFSAGAGVGDILEFDNSLFVDFEAVLAAAAQIGKDTVITYDAENTITLKNVALSSLHEDDVRFVA